MRSEQASWRNGSWSWQAGPSLRDAQLVLVFGGPQELAAGNALEALAAAYPAALLAGCSTAGEIHGTTVTENTIAATAVRLERSTLRAVEIALAEVAGDSYAGGRRLGSAFDPDGLAHVLVFSDGLHVNGSDLVRGLAETLPAHVAVTGGLAGDGDRFQQTFVVARGRPLTRSVVAIGLYGEHLEVGHASLGGWDPFGPERIVTRAAGNVLYELDGHSALHLYKQYLGEHAGGLPATGLLFPLAVRRSRDAAAVVRTILAADEEHQSLTFAGDVPVGSYARLMKANFDRLIEGAAGAARNSIPGDHRGAPELALLISCVGRKMVLQQRVEEEVEAVQDVYGDETVLAGFYSYGEISPFTPNGHCELHNQTMTVTTLREH